MNQQEVYDKVTKKILDMLEQGVIPWSQPWGAGGHEQIRVNGSAYRGFNQFLLTVEKIVKRYKSKVWLTYNQAKAFKGCVRKGEKGTPILYFQFLKKIDEKTKKEKRIPLTRFYTVFNLDQCDGCVIPERLQEKPKPTVNPIESCQKVIDGFKGAPPVVHLQHMAFYSPSRDEINMPEVNTFKTFAHYAGVLYHEMIHSTGHEKRLDRSNIQSAYHFDRSVRSFEELIAELGSSYLCGVAGVETVTIDNSAAYIQSWLKHLKNDPSEIVKAASQAQKAADWILGVNRKDDDEEENEAE